MFSSIDVAFLLIFKKSSSMIEIHPPMHLILKNSGLDQ